MQKYLSSLKTFLVHYFPSLCSGLLIGTSYIPFPPWALFFCYVPLWILSSKSPSLWRVFWSGWWTQFILSLIGFHWVSHTAYEFGHLPWPVAIMTLLVFCSLVHLYIPLSLVVTSYCQRKFQISQLTTFFLFAISLSISEQLWPSLFPWHLGYTTYSSGWPMYQWADIIGFEGLSTLILLANAAVACAWVIYKNQKDRNQQPQWQKKCISYLAIPLLIFTFLNLTGTDHSQKWKETDALSPVLVVQANIGNLERMQAEKGRGFQDEILNQHIDLTEKGLEKYPSTEWIVWPETAYPDHLGESYQNTRRGLQLLEAIQKWGRPLVTGSFARDPYNPNPQQNTFNAIFALSWPQQQAASYRKTHLLAFGEYLPFSETFPILLQWVPMVSNFGRGHGPMTLPLSTQKYQYQLGPQICYEGLYPRFSRELAQKGAEIIVNVTNDSWFGKISEPQQHLYMTLARAIETRRPLIRSTNTGISTAALADGTILERSPLHQSWAGLLEIKYKKNPELTFYTKYGEYWIWFSVILFFFLLGLSRLCHNRQP